MREFHFHFISIQQTKKTKKMLRSNQVKFNCYRCAEPKINKNKNVIESKTIASRTLNSKSKTQTNIFLLSYKLQVQK